MALPRTPLKVFLLVTSLLSLLLLRSSSLPEIHPLLGGTNETAPLSVRLDDEFAVDNATMLR